MLKLLSRTVLCIITFSLAIPSTSFSETALVPEQAKQQTPLKKKALIFALAAGTSIAVTVCMLSLSRGLQGLLLENSIYDQAKEGYKKKNNNKEVHSFYHLRKHIEETGEGMSSKLSKQFIRDENRVINIIGYPSFLSILAAIICAGISIRYWRKHKKEEKNKLSPKTS